MPSEVVKQGGALANPGDIGAFIARVAMDKDFDLQKFQSLVEMKDRAESKAAEAAFNQAMREAQAEMLPVVRAKENSSTHNKYADLEAIDNVIRPIYMRYGFCMTFDCVAASEVGGKPDDVAVRCAVLHDAGHTRTYGPMVGAPDTAGPQGKPTKTAIQGTVSSSSYLQRVLTRLVWNVRFKDGDQDGNAGGGGLSDHDMMTIETLFRDAGMDDKGKAQFFITFGIKELGDIKYKRDLFTPVCTMLTAKARGKQK